MPVYYDPHLHGVDQTDPPFLHPAPYPHVPYRHPTPHASVYGQGAYPSGVVQPEELEYREEGVLGMECVPANMEVRPSSPSPSPPRHNGIFNSPLLQPSRQMAQDAPEAQYDIPPIEHAEETAPVAVAVRESPVSEPWTPPSTGYTYPSAPMVMDHLVRPPSPYSPSPTPSPPPLALAPGLQPPDEGTFPSTLRRSPRQEARERGPIQPPRLLNPESLPRGPNPASASTSAGSPSPASTSSGSTSRPSASTSRRRRPRSPTPTAGSSRSDTGDTPIVPSQAPAAARRDRSGRGHRAPTFRPFHPYPTYPRGEECAAPGPDGIVGTTPEGARFNPTAVFGLFGSYPLSRAPRGESTSPTCAPASSSSVLRLTLTPAVKRPPPPPPPPPMVPPRRPRMACYFCRKRKIACGPGPPCPPRARQSDGNEETEDGEPPEPPCKCVFIVISCPCQHVLIHFF